MSSGYFEYFYDDIRRHAQRPHKNIKYYILQSDTVASGSRRDEASFEVSSS